MSVVFRPATSADADDLAQSMRAIDRVECVAVSGLAPRAALEMSMASADWSIAAEESGKVWCIFGVSPGDFLADEGHPWMLAAEGIERHPSAARALLELGRYWVQSMRYSLLSNLVHRDNAAAIRWLRRLGFEFGRSEARGGEPFVWFWMERA
jgi:ribosomal protein S18 acetylase RimI-like enzyme